MKIVIWCAVSSEAQAAEDKVSLAEQERLGRVFAQANGGLVIAVLKVPGYSRRESDVLTAMEDFARQGITAYHDLRAMWQRRAFDVLYAHNHSRFGRSSTLHAFVVENTIHSGARIYLEQGGWIGENDLRFSIALGNIAATSDVDRLVKSRTAALDAKAQRGLPVSPHPPFTHRVIRNDSGKVVAMEVDAAKRRLFDDIAQLLLDGLSFTQLPDALAERGHLNKRGKPYVSTNIHRWLHTPTTWGHMARHHTHHANGPKRRSRGARVWSYDDSTPPPDGVTLYRDTHEPVFSPQYIEPLKAELKRRSLHIAGKRQPWRSTSPFSGLCVCGECGHVLKVHYDGRLLACRQRWQGNCTQRSIRTDDVRAWMDGVLRMVLRDDDLTPLFGDTQSAEDRAVERLAQLDAEAADVNAQIQRLIVKQATAPDSLQHAYDAQLAALGRQLDALHIERTRADSELAQARGNLNSTAMRQLRTDGFIDSLWQQPNMRINQFLVALLGDYRIVVMKRRVIGVARPLS